MNEITLSDAELLPVLSNSLYPGARKESVRMVIAYCRAAKLDPMLKCVHIVPMWDRASKQMKDVIMPGIGLYRIQASRTGSFAGQSEPEFGPEVTKNLSGVEFTFPEWAKVTVKKIVHGAIAEFTAIEYWLENYAVRGGQEKSIAPNSMWAKRPRGQIAKCAAAQALRMAFPEIGAQPTAEEMEGKGLESEYVDEEGVIVNKKPTVKTPTVREDPGISDVTDKREVDEPKTSDTTETAALCTPGEIIWMKKRMASKGMDIPEDADFYTREQFNLIKGSK